MNRIFITLRLLSEPSFRYTVRTAWRMSKYIADRQKGWRYV